MEQLVPRFRPARRVLESFLRQVQAVVIRVLIPAGILAGAAAAAGQGARRNKFPADGAVAGILIPRGVTPPRTYAAPRSNLNTATLASRLGSVRTTLPA